MKQNFRCTIPASRNVIRVRWTRPDFPRKAKVGDFYEFRSVAKEILRLQVAMKESVPVHKSQARQDLEENDFDCVLGEMCLAILNELIEVLLHVLEHKVKNVVLTNHFLKLNDVRVREFLQ